MEKEYPYTGSDRENPWSSEGPWNGADDSQSGLVDQWQGQGKRLCIPNSFGDFYPQMEMTLDAPSLLSNEAFDLSGFVESSMSLPGLTEIPDLLCGNNGSGVSPMNLSLPPEMQNDRYLQPASYFPAFYGAFNPNELWTFEEPSKTLELFTGSSETSFVAYSGMSVGEDLVHYHEDIPQNSNLLHGATTRMCESSTGGETPSSLLLQPQSQESSGWKSIASSISDKINRTAYECIQNGVSENVTATLVEDSKYASPAESLLLSQSEKDTQENGVAEDFPSFQSQVARNQETLHNALPKQNEEIDEVEYDTCFGMIRTGPVKLQGRCLDAKSSVDQEITLKIYDDIVMVYHTQTMRYEGIINHNTGQKSRSLQITLYGLRQDSDAVGTLLSENKIYLQQPSTFDSSAIYFNPQYLVRPVSEFKLAVQGNFQCPVREKQMAQAVRSEMLRVFDAAVGPAIFSEVQVSKRLTKELKPYQRKTLAMMVEKESGIIENPEFPPLWVPKTVKGGSKRYWNSVTGHNQHHPPRLCLGGLLADVGSSLSLERLIEARDYAGNTVFARVPIGSCSLTAWANALIKHLDQTP